MASEGFVDCAIYSFDHEGNTAWSGLTTQKTQKFERAFVNQWHDPMRRLRLFSKLLGTTELFNLVIVEFDVNDIDDDEDSSVDESLMRAAKQLSDFDAGKDGAEHSSRFIIDMLDGDDVIIRRVGIAKLYYENDYEKFLLTPNYCYVVSYDYNTDVFNVYEQYIDPGSFALLNTDDRGRDSEGYHTYPSELTHRMDVLFSACSSVLDEGRSLELISTDFEYKGSGSYGAAFGFENEDKTKEVLKFPYLSKGYGFLARKNDSISFESEFKNTIGMRKNLMATQHAGVYNKEIFIFRLAKMDEADYDTDDYEPERHHDGAIGLDLDDGSSQRGHGRLCKTPHQGRNHASLLQRETDWRTFPALSAL